MLWQALRPITTCLVADESLKPLFFGVFVPCTFTTDSFSRKYVPGTNIPADGHFVSRTSISDCHIPDADVLHRSSAECGDLGEKDERSSACPCREFGTLYQAYRQVNGPDPVHFLIEWPKNIRLRVW